MMSSSTFKALQPQDFRFYGFDHLTSEIEDALHDIGIRSDPLRFETVENAIYVPVARAPMADGGTGKAEFVGSLLTHDGQAIEFAQARRRTLRLGPLIRGGPTGHAMERAVDRPQRVVDEEVVYLGWLIPHFGHFLSESLSRTWFLDEIDPAVKVVFHRTKDYTPAGTIGQILDAFGVPPDRLLLLDEPALLRRAIVPEPVHELHWSIHERAPERFRRIAAALVGGGRASDQPLYLSRRLLSSQTRPIIGEFELEEVLRENGFRIAYPETMTFHDQVRMFNQHTHIFTSAGSAAYNVMFSLHGPTLHTITAELPRQDYFLLPAVSGAAGSYCNGLDRGGRSYFKKTPLRAELPTLTGYLAAEGFLKKRLHASLAAIHQPNLQAEFDEAWFCAMVRDVPRGEALSDDIGDEAFRRAGESWPLTWLLASHLASRDPAAVDGLVRQFTQLACVEDDVGKLVRFRADIESMASRVMKHCGPATAASLAAVLAERFLLNTVAGRRVRGDDAGHGGKLPRQQPSG